MQTKDVSAELEQVLSQLHQQGKTPSVALVKSHLKSNIPMPAIVAAIRGWKGNQTIPKIEVSADIEPASEQRIEQLEQQVSSLVKRVISLEEKIEQLEAKQ
jgi:uncharacterized protein YceH (UPF0502 family)